MQSREKLRVGDWVEVRSKEEILKTLDSDGKLDGLPFMPEMLAYCGRRFRVYKRAHKACDPVYTGRSGSIERAVHLETRCSGAAHGGCQAGCLLFWKEAWLKPVPPGSSALHSLDSASQIDSKLGDLDSQDSGLSVKVSDADGSWKFMCQATEIPRILKPIHWWDIRQYIEDYASGNVDALKMLRGLIYSTYYNLSQAGVGLGPVMRRLYDLLSPIWGGPPFPRHSGRIPVGQPTPAVDLGLKPGELVRVKPYSEILQTLTTENRNRGMTWDAELVPYCGGSYRVLRRVDRIIDEKTGRMLELKNPCIILDSVVCQARYSGCRMFCPRSIYPYWREIWLERIQPDQQTQA